MAVKEFSIFNFQFSNKKPKNLYLHVDGDSFFVACELTTHPELKGRPVIVGGDRGIAVAMSKEAKKLGVHRGMPVFKIKKLYPEVVILDHHFELYRDISEKLFQILSSYFKEVEVYSIDECFALVRPSEVKYYGGEEKLMKELKKEIEATLGVTYSLGLARTKALSKLASKLEKPAGLVILLSKADEIKALESTPIDDIWGIGWRTVPKLKLMGLETAYDFVNLPASRVRDFSEPLRVLKKELGGEQVLKVESNTDPRDQKSLQSTRTFHPASTDPKIIWREMAENGEHACESIRGLKLVSNKASFFVKTSEFKYFFGEVKLPYFTSDPGVILNAIEPQFPRLVASRKRIRSTGVTLHNLTKEENVPRDLFGKQEKALKDLVVEETADRIREKYGSGAITRASTLGKKSLL